MSSGRSDSLGTEDPSGRTSEEFSDSKRCSSDIAHKFAMETTEVLRTEEIVESLLARIEKAKTKILAKIANKRKKLVKSLAEAGLDFEVFTKKWSTTFVTVTAALSIFLTTALPITAASIPEVLTEISTPSTDVKENLRQRILDYVQKARFRKLNAQVLSDLVGKITGLPAKVTLDGNKIPAVGGVIATEKHLKIYPAETLAKHLKNSQDFEKFSWTGISNSPSAWGYFAKDEDFVTDNLVEKEKYYLAIQTFAAKDWTKNWPELKEWYKFRKLLVYNPENGKAVVGVVADAGPAQYTGRNFGGSPELMDELELSSSTTGNVLVFFLDDPGNSIPLGPVQNESL